MGWRMNEDNEQLVSLNDFFKSIREVDKFIKENPNDEDVLKLGVKPNLVDYILTLPSDTLFSIVSDSDIQSLCMTFFTYGVFSSGIRDERIGLV
jgi:hypothetical protein